MNINLNKTINELAPLQIADLIEIDLSTVRAVASGSNGQFLIDRAALAASEFLNKYFGDYEVFDTLEKIEARRKAEIVLITKAMRTKIARPADMDDYGNYVVAIWECGNEFAVSYRKTDYMQAHWDVLSKHEIEYKTDGRRFSIVFNTNSRKDAMMKKDALIAELTNRGMSNKGELPV